jgi:hypothetical protein
VLRLDGLATAHLYYLARPFPRLRLDSEPEASSLLQELIDSWPLTPALVVGGDTDDPAAARLVSELSERSERFRHLWDRHDIRVRTSGISVFKHPQAGLLELHYHKMAILSASGPYPGAATQYLLTFQAEQGSASAHRLASLAEAVAGADALPERH